MDAKPFHSMDFMQRYTLFFVGTLFLFACGNCGNASELPPEAAAFIEENTIAKTDISELEVPEEKKIRLSDVGKIDSLLFEKSMFKNIGCSREFMFQQKGPECCCNEILDKYTAMKPQLKARELATINAKDPLMKKCREKMKGWGKRLDAINNPPPANNSGVDPDI